MRLVLINSSTWIWALRAKLCLAGEMRAGKGVGGSSSAGCTAFPPRCLLLRREAGCGKGLRPRRVPQAPLQPLPPATPQCRARAALPSRARRVGARAALSVGRARLRASLGRRREGRGPLCAGAVAKVGVEGARPRASCAVGPRTLGFDWPPLSSRCP